MLITFHTNISWWEKDFAIRQNFSSILRPPNSFRWYVFAYHMFSIHEHCTRTIPPLPHRMASILPSDIFSAANFRKCISYFHFRHVAQIPPHHQLYRHQRRVRCRSAAPFTSLVKLSLLHNFSGLLPFSKRISRCVEMPRSARSLVSLFLNGASFTPSSGHFLLFRDDFFYRARLVNISASRTPLPIPPRTSRVIFTIGRFTCRWGLLISRYFLYISRLR